jgi:predicted lipoprotein
LTVSAGAYRCHYAGAIATLVADLAQTLDAEWADPAGISDAMLHPKPGAVDYRNLTEVLEKLAATLVHGTETIRDQRLKPILGASTGKPRPKSALFWRSEMTAPALAANFAGLAEFFTRAKFPEAIGTENGWIANGANFEFANAARASAVVSDPIEQALIDPHQVKALNYLVLITGSLDTLLGENLAAALGLSVGFSALDGD